MHRWTSYDLRGLQPLRQDSCHCPQVLRTRPTMPGFPSTAPPWPWKSMSIWRLMTWMMTGSRQKSEDEVTHLIHEVIQAEDFDRTHLDQFNARTQLRKFDNSENAPGEDSTNLRQDSWRESSVCILVPTQEQNPDGNGQPFKISGLFHCPLTGVIRAAFAEQAARWFHFTPFKHIWKSVKTVQTSRGNSGNSGVGQSWLGLGLSLCAMPLLLIGSRRSGADRRNSEMLVMSTSSR